MPKWWSWFYFFFAVLYGYAFIRTIGNWIAQVDAKAYHEGIDDVLDAARNLNVEQPIHGQLQGE